MPDRLPSLDLLLDLVETERDKQLAHFDALDNKAGIVLGFGGLLITLAPTVPLAARVLSLAAALMSVGLPSRRSTREVFPSSNRVPYGPTSEQRRRSRS